MSIACDFPPCSRAYSTLLTSNYRARSHYSCATASLKVYIKAKWHSKYPKIEAILSSWGVGSMATAQTVGLKRGATNTG